MVPLKTLNLIESYLDSLRSDPNHVLTTNNRINIYQSFGTSKLDKFFENERSKPKKRLQTIFPPEDYSDLDELKELAPANKEILIRKIETQFQNFTVADYAQSWLAILTVEKVLFIWEKWSWDLYELSDHPQQEVRIILDTATKYLQKTIEVRKVFDLLCGEFNLGLNIDNFVPYQVYNVYAAAYFALDFIIDSADSYMLNITASFDNYDEAVYDKDFATCAVKAFSALDPNPTGEYKLWPNKFDLRKRLEFWEWWLTEAIPQAWELAQQSTNETRQNRGR